MNSTYGATSRSLLLNKEQENESFVSIDGHLSAYYQKGHSQSRSCWIHRFASSEVAAAVVCDLGYILHPVLKSLTTNNGRIFPGEISSFPFESRGITKTSSDLSAHESSAVPLVLSHNHGTSATDWI